MKNELLTILDRAQIIYISSNASLYDAYVQIDKKAARIFIEHNFNIDIGMNIAIKGDELFLERRNSTKE
jgi:hypothetical protein